MHRDDLAFADRIELEFISKGLRPEQGEFITEDGGACALGALGCHNSYEASRLLNIEQDLVISLEQGFDCYGYPDDIEETFRRECVDQWEGHDYDRASRLFRIGYSVAKRMFSKAPVESVESVETVLL